MSDFYCVLCNVKWTYQWFLWCDGRTFFPSKLLAFTYSCGSVTRGNWPVLPDHLIMLSSLLLPIHTFLSSPCLHFMKLLWFSKSLYYCVLAIEMRSIIKHPLKEKKKKIIYILLYILHFNSKNVLKISRVISLSFSFIIKILKCEKVNVIIHMMRKLKQTMQKMISQGKSVYVFPALWF